MFSSICLNTIWQCTSLIFTCEVDWKFSNKIHWKYANLLNYKNCGDLLNSGKLLGENGLFDCKVWLFVTQLKGNFKTWCFYCACDILTQICFMKTLKTFNFVSMKSEKYWTLRSFCEIWNVGFLCILFHTQYFSGHVFIRMLM